MLGQNDNPLLPRFSGPLSKALARVIITDVRFESSPVPGLLNPESLKPAIEVAIGVLDPVGASSSTLQYGHTKAMQLPIELYFSSQFQGRMASAYQDMNLYTNYFSSFCYSTQDGGAPPLMLLIWPKVMDVCLAVKNFAAELTRFSSYDMSLQAVKITLQTLEWRVSPRRADHHRQVGFTERDPNIAFKTNDGGKRLKLRPGKR